MIEILRLGHRLPRDERISTHVALVARAFGADSVVYSGQHDSGLETSVERICDNWGGKTKNSKKFSIKYEKSHVRYLKAQKKAGFIITHLTMYGIPITEALPKLRTQNRILVVVGAEQVPREIYDLADFNISVTNQPHSEVAALAITLDRLMEGKELESGTGDFDFRGKIRIVPSERGKKVVRS